jgi:hypothetical protein
MMPNKTHKHMNMILGATTLVTSLTTLFLTAVAQNVISVPTAVQGIVLQSSKRGEAPWKTINEEQIAYGYTIPKNTHSIIKLPKSFIELPSTTLFGQTDEEVRYWGYCFAETAAETSLSALPGTFFMSDAEEQSILDEEREKMRLAVSKGRLTDKNLNLLAKNSARVRNEKLVFKPGDVCYVMSKEPIPIGLDPDKDFANNRIERQHKTNPNLRDTDGDGILDGIEIHRLRTLPLVRDTDGDGLIDGMEDKNRNGVIEQGETSPLNLDSDADGLCDGHCRVDKGRSVAGEDLNLNGLVDEGETSPLLRDTDGDGILDEQEFFLCQLKGKLGGDCN